MYNGIFHVITSGKNLLNEIHTCTIGTQKTRKISTFDEVARKNTRHPSGLIRYIIEKNENAEGIYYGILPLNL